MRTIFMQCDSIVEVSFYLCYKSSSSEKFWKVLKKSSVENALVTEREPILRNTLASNVSRNSSSISIKIRPKLRMKLCITAAFLLKIQPNVPHKIVLQIFDWLKSILNWFPFHQKKINAASYLLVLISFPKRSSHIFRILELETHSFRTQSSI